MLQNRIKVLPAQPADHTTRHPEPYKGHREGRFRLRTEHCAAQYLRLLTDEPLRRGIARRGHERARRNNHYNEPMLAPMINRAVRVFEERL